MAHETILVVDDEQLLRRTMARRLRTAGYDVLEAADGRQALELAADGVDLVVLDYRLPDLDGLSVLKELKQRAPDTLVILLTAYASIDAAVTAMKLGAYHFANKPLDLEALVAMVEQALETTRLRREVRQLRASQAQPYSLEQIVGSSPAMTSLKAMIQEIAASPASTVLLLGESGSGKDLVAKVLHYTSARASRPFVNITCSALPETLLESELFGYERGAFTDARQMKRGLLESADGGTVFLDEIGEMPLLLQAKLLRFLEEKTLRRLGGSSDLRVDVRIVAATNRALEEEVRAGRFREDLFYRLNVLTLAVPPLRERGEDILQLARHFLEQACAQIRRTPCRLVPATYPALLANQWPGNVRQLQNVIFRAAAICEGSAVEISDLDIACITTAVPPEEVGSLSEAVSQFERELLETLYASYPSSRLLATRLRTSHTAIAMRLRKYGIPSR